MKKKRKKRKHNFKIIPVVLILILLAGFCLKEKQMISLPVSANNLLSHRITQMIGTDVEDYMDDFFEIIGECLKWIKAFVRTMEMYYGGEKEQTETLLAQIPEYSGEPYYVLNKNIPYFTKEDRSVKSFEKYTDLDLLGRCGETFACIGKDIMPTEERGPIGMIKPSGWKLKKYDIVDGKYLYNRCHLIGYQLTGENANEKNLITGTRYMNVEGMLPFENKVADYVEKTGNHVLYRVTPLFEGNNLLATGVQMEAWSVEDYGMGICFHVFVYNAQPGIGIDYKTGESRLLEQ